MASTKVLPNSQNQFQNHIDWTIQSGVCRPNSENEIGASQPPRNITDGQRRDQDHVGVLGEEEHRERHARVLDHVAGDDLRLALDDVERRAVGLGDARDEVDDEDRQQRQPVPATGRSAPCVGERCRLPWPSTMSVMFRLAETISTTTSAKPIAIS